VKALYGIANLIRHSSMSDESLNIPKHTIQPLKSH